MPHITDMARRLLLDRWDDALRDTRMIVREGALRHTIGRRDGGADVETVELDVRHPRFFARTVSLGTLGLGEAYMDEDYEVEGGVDRLYMALMRNRLNFKSRSDPLFMIQYLLVLAHNRLQPRAANVDAHYALGDDLFESFLDPMLIYTSGYALTKDDDLETMQRRKLDRVCQKLRLTLGETLLDLGCGWGGMLIHAAREYGVRGVGINICREQVDSARRRVAAAGLSDRIDILFGDHLSAPATYDKVVSLGMQEHLQPGEYPGFCKALARYLRMGGLAMIHGVDNSGAVNKHDPFVQKYIFPNSNQSLLSDIARSCERAGLAVLDVENYARSYYLTVRRWHQNFEANRHKLDPVRYPPRFIRMWQIYLAWALAACRYSSGANWEIVVTNDHMRDHPLGRI